MSAYWNISYAVFGWVIGSFMQKYVKSAKFSLNIDDTLWDDAHHKQRKTKHTKEWDTIDFRTGDE